MIVLLLGFFFAFFAKALCSTYVVNPLDNQLPLVARVNQPFSWTFSERTFNSSDGVPLTYSVPNLPSWLSFDPTTRTFSGTPTSDDEGNPKVTVVATGGHSTASSSLRFCVTSFPAPTLAVPITDQFNPSNQALSSVFVLSTGSALASPNPGLRIPPGPWSFSIGFEWGTYTSPNDIFYTIRLVDGNDIPPWMVFDPDDITLDGVVPADVGANGPVVYPLLFIASDQEGYAAETIPFDITIAGHELSANAQELPTINVTAGTSFTASLLSPADFTGILVDGDLIQPSNITHLMIDTTGLDWVRYDPPSRTLSGTPASNLSQSNGRFTLPVNLTTWFNQTLSTTVSIRLVPSYFSLPELPALHLAPGDHFELNLNQFYSNATAGRSGDADLSVSLEPAQAANFIRFNANNDTISGTIPNDFASDHLIAAFTAYSQVTHSTSHATLVIFVSPGRNAALPRPAGLSVEGHRRLVLGLAITFGVLGGLLVMTCFFAWLRRVVRVEDTALTGEEGRYGWTKSERRYYGLDVSSEKASSMSDLTSQHHQYGQPPGILDPRRSGSSFGHGLQPSIPERNYPTIGNDMYSDVMSKREFMSRVRQTVRQVSNRYNGRGKQQSSPLRPVIGRPILLRPSIGMDLNPSGNPQMRPSPSNPFDDVHSHRASTFMTGSPSTSTAEHSIPRRRADFAPPRSMAQVHFEDGHLVRQPSYASAGSDRLEVVSRHTSVRSGRSTSHLSHEYDPDGPLARPRLVPFTSSTRVPVPRVPSLIASPSAGPTASPSATKSRIGSQRAKIVKPSAAGDGIAKSTSADELTMGLHYVQSLGDQSPAVAEPPKPPRRAQEVTRYVLRTGEKFHIRLQIPATGQKIQVTQVSGQEIPKFLHVDVNAVKGMVDFTGIALSRDLGMLTVGVYADKELVSKVILEVIPRR
ncbi:hypothetical protein CC1G_00925 [Coprinopsis cinerea okayama7|uniref:Dystroglycan-type cadherin-like domain-containing protein n=1 Tax=Coprinopsis cinerea (strain Okayama-7 / 130 / ATCC MYA-4618 / FGSC 9003) TaxID=240176 RepID=A8N950_COPC7|nr:hypothetical protein CC1G_00925 [Coprinopsis cinerea okayama7\|eukprot:XP_001831378.1 hypothetical protein CC1G_00925 [Coprinopsis cinerea okayama7\